MGRGTHWMQVFTLALGGCDNHRCHNKTPDKKWDCGCELRHVQKRWAEDFGWFLKKKAVSWDLKLDEWVEIRSWTKRVDFWTWARPVQLWTTGCPCVVGSDGTVSRVEICHSLLVSKNPKVKKLIKVSYLNYREPSVFRVFFGFLCIQTFYISEYFTY